MAAETGPNSALALEAHARAQGRTLSSEYNFAHPCLGKNRIIDRANGTVELLMPDGSAPRTKFALVGFAGSTRGYAPLDKPEWAIVGMNQLYRWLTYKNAAGEEITRHPDLWFEIHKEWNTAVVPGTDYRSWLKGCDVPVYMAYAVPDLPTSLGFPIDRMAAKFNDYFTSTVAYMMAWVIDHIDRLVEDRLRAQAFSFENQLQAVEAARKLYGEYTIGIFGIDLIVGTEYFEQKPCAEFWIGQACGRGIEVMIPPESALVTQHYRYGYDIEPKGHIKSSDLDKMHAELAQAHHNASAEAIRLSGRIEENRRMRELFDLRTRGGRVEF